MTISKNRSNFKAMAANRVFSLYECRETGGAGFIGYFTADALKSYISGSERYSRYGNRADIIETLLAKHRAYLEPHRYLDIWKMSSERYPALDILRDAINDASGPEPDRNDQADGADNEPKARIPDWMYEKFGRDQIDSFHDIILLDGNIVLKIDDIRPGSDKDIGGAVSGLMSMPFGDGILRFKFTSVYDDIRKLKHQNEITGLSDDMVFDAVETPDLVGLIAKYARILKKYDIAGFWLDIMGNGL